MHGLLDPYGLLFLVVSEFRNKFNQESDVSEETAPIQSSRTSNVLAPPLSLLPLSTDRRRRGHPTRAHPARVVDRRRSAQRLNGSLPSLSRATPKHNHDLSASVHITVSMHIFATGICERAFRRFHQVLKISGDIASRHLVNKEIN
jgi:hypothetical protein